MADDLRTLFGIPNPAQLPWTDRNSPLAEGAGATPQQAFGTSATPSSPEQTFSPAGIGRPQIEGYPISSTGASPAEMASVASVIRNRMAKGGFGASPSDMRRISSSHGVSQARQTTQRSTTPQVQPISRRRPSHRECSTARCKIQPRARRISSRRPRKRLLGARGRHGQAASRSPRSVAINFLR
jgi:hypothetical protein